MSYYKKCLCGHLNIYERPGTATPFCEKCSRQIIHIPEEEYTDEVKSELNTKSKTHRYILMGENLENIEFETEVIIGRNSYGKEVLANFPDVSREHIIITPRSSGIAVTITDISTYGTYINEKKIEKNIPKMISNGAKIRLANQATFILHIGENE